MRVCGACCVAVYISITDYGNVIVGVRGDPERRIFPACVGTGLRRGFLFPSVRRPSSVHVAPAGRFPAPAPALASTNAPPAQGIPVLV